MAASPLSRAWDNVSSGGCSSGAELAGEDMTALSLRMHKGVAAQS